MRMEPEDIRRIAKKTGIIASFFVVALVLYFLGRDGRTLGRALLLAYALGVTVLMVLAILVQSGRGGGLAGMGGAAGESLLGARAATPIAKATYVMGALLLFICMLMARMGHLRSVAPAVRPDTVPIRTEEAPSAPPAPPAPDADADGEETG